MESPTRATLPRVPWALIPDQQWLCSAGWCWWLVLVLCEKEILLAECSEDEANRVNECLSILMSRFDGQHLALLSLAMIDSVSSFFWQKIFPYADLPLPMIVFSGLAD